jgi:hypothetical protein|tara:strand:+ start:739 stop:933 length:195 start_codon:yes stop_codon:yes gene_type:complete
MVDGVSISGFDGTSISSVNRKIESRIENAGKGPSIEAPEKDDDEKKKAAGANSSGRGTIVDISV